MGHAIGIAAIFGPYMVILGLWMLLYSENLTKVITAMKNSPACFYILGIINLIVGLTIVNMYNVWSADLAFLVTLFGWVTLIRGILMFFFPQVIIKMCMAKEKKAQLWGIIPLVWGLLLSWLAFHS